MRSKNLDISSKIKPKLTQECSQRHKYDLTPFPFQGMDLPSYCCLSRSIACEKDDHFFHSRGEPLKKWVELRIQRGASLSLVTGSLRGDSIDVDIIIPPAQDLDPLIKQILGKGIFMRTEEDERTWVSSPAPLPKLAVKPPPWMIITDTPHV